MQTKQTQTHTHTHVYLLYNWTTNRPAQFPLATGNGPFGPPRRLQDGPRRLFLPILSPSFWHLFSDDAPRRLQDDPRGLQNGPRRAKTVFLSQHGPMLAPTWTHVGTKIAFRRYLMLKQPES